MTRLHINSYFMRLLISFLALIMLTLFFSSLMIYRNYVSETIKENSAISERMLSNTVNRTELNLDWASMHAFELYGNNYVFSAIYGDEVSSMDEYNAQKIISYAMNSNPLIYSAYLYNRNIDHFFSNFTYRHSSNEFFDREIVKILNDKSIFGQFIYIPRTIHYNFYNKEYNEDVISLIVTDSPQSNEPVKGALVMNLKTNSIQEDSTSTNNDDDDFSIIIDRDNKVISHSLPGFFLKDLSDEKYIASVKSTSTASGYFTEMIDGKKYLVTYVKSDKLKWSFIRVYLYSKLFEKANGLRNLIIIFSIMLYILSAIFAVLLAWRFYSPIGRLVKMIRKDAGDTGKTGSSKEINEIEYISRAYQGIIDNFKLLKQQNMDNKEYLRNEFLKDLLTVGVPNHIDLNSKFRELGIDLDLNNFMIVLLRIDDYRDNSCKVNNEEDVMLIRFAISNITGEIISPYYNNKTIDMGDDMVLVILNTKDENIQSVHDTLKGLIGQIQKAIKDHFKYEISSSMGQIAQKPSQLPNAFKLALDISNYRLIFGKGCIIIPDMIKKNIETSYSYSEKVEKDILDGLRLCNYQVVEEKTDMFFESLEFLAYDYIMMSLSRLVYISLKVINEISAQKGYEYNFKKLQSELVHFNTLEEIKKWILGLFKQYIQSMSNSLQNVKLSHVQKIEDIIRKEYGNPNLSPEEIASHLNLSTNYIREIFKEFKGISLSNYINDYRCEVAKELLLNTKMTILKICEKVGIANENYFYTLFKKHSGFTPVQFRKRHDDSVIT